MEFKIAGLDSKQTKPIRQNCLRSMTLRSLARVTNIRLIRALKAHYFSKSEENLTNFGWFHSNQHLSEEHSSLLNWQLIPLIYVDPTFLNKDSLPAWHIWCQFSVTAWMLWSVSFSVRRLNVSASLRFV